jgi:shikimate kinase
MTHNIILIGFRGTGKTTLSTECAVQLGLQRISTDERVVERLGMSIAEFVQQRGWAEFRRIEHEEIRALQGKTGFVIDCGGGVVENPENMRFLGEMGNIIWVDAALEDVISRLLQNADDQQRPLLTHGDARADIEANYTRRRPMYEQYAELHINTSLLSTEQCIQSVQSFLEGGL